MRLEHGELGALGGNQLVERGEATGYALLFVYVLRISKTTATDWQPDAGWAGGSTAITKSVHTRRWAMRRRRECTLIPVLTEPSQPVGKPCNPIMHGHEKRLEVRPPSAVSMGTPANGRGRTGGAQHDSFSLFQMNLKRRVNDRQTKATMTADRENPSYFLRSVV